MKRDALAERRAFTVFTAGIAFALTACGSAAKVTSGTNEPAPAGSPSAAASPGASSPCAPVSEPYEPRPARSGDVRLPEVPELPQRPIKVGEAYTVWGASYSLRSRVHRAEVLRGPVTIEGYIVKTNLPDAPRCAVHRSGQADPPDCRAPIPSFWIGDTIDAAPEASIKVMGWASNYAQIYDAIRVFDAAKADAEYVDVFWGVPLPNPLPAVGAKVSVSGTYSPTFAMATSGAEADPFMGLLTYKTMQYLEPAPELAVLPGMRRAKIRR